jgi:hypothetical protein
MQCIYSVVARINYPDKGGVNINTNVAIFGMEKIGLGVAMLDEKGEVMLTASKPVDPPFAVEVGGAFAAQHGLLLASNRYGLCGAVLKTNCKPLSHALRPPHFLPRELSSAVVGSIHIGSSFSSYSPRSSSHIAHALSRMVG